MGVEIYWYTFFVIIVLVFIGVIAYSRDKRYFYYFLTGVAVGFYLDLVSVSQGYYTYYPFFPTLFGIPLTVTIAEGCSVSLTVFIYKKTIPYLISKFFSRGR